MSQSDTTLKTISLRLQTDLHGLVKEFADNRGTSITDYITKAVRRAVAEELIESPVTEGAPTPFELHLQFTVNGPDADQRAYQIVDGMTNLAGLTGATELTSRLTRLAVMQARSTEHA
jgi:hypothetical protein